MPLHDHVPGTHQGVHPATGKWHPHLSTPTPRTGIPQYPPRHMRTPHTTPQHTQHSGQKTAWNVPLCVTRTTSRPLLSAPWGASHSGCGVGMDWKKSTLESQALGDEPRPGLCGCGCRSTAEGSSGGTACLVVKPLEKTACALFRVPGCIRAPLPVDILKCDSSSNGIPATHLRDLD